MSRIALPYSAKIAFAGGRVAAADALERIANQSLPKVTVKNLRKHALEQFRAKHQHLVELPNLVAEWKLGFDDALADNNSYIAAGGAKGHARAWLIDRVSGKAGALVALLSALDHLPGSEQTKTLATCVKLAAELVNGLNDLGGGVA